MAVHPMDEISVRQLRFEFSDISDANPVWSASCPDFSIFMNALGIHVPHFEHFLVAVMRAYRAELSDQTLLSDVQAIIGQESHHAFNFINWTRTLEKHYPGVLALDAHASDYFKGAFSSGSKKFSIGFTAGYETFTFLGGMIILNRYEELMGEADPVLRALWVWHQVEEVEHGAVAFDFYRAFYPDDEWYRRWMVLRAFAHISHETFVAFRLMVKQMGFVGRRKRQAWLFFARFARDLFVAALPVFRKDYHPRNHPICNEEQNAIAIAWRDYYSKGNDAGKLTSEDMNLLIAS